MKRVNGKGCRLRFIIRWKVAVFVNPGSGVDRFAKTLTMLRSFQHIHLLWIKFLRNDLHHARTFSLQSADNDLSSDFKRTI